MLQKSIIFEGLLENLNASWVSVSDLLHLPHVYELIHETPIPYIPFGVTLWSIFHWAILILLVAPRVLGFVFSIVMFFVARIPGVRLTIAKISFIDGFRDIKFHYDVPEMNISVSVDAITFRPWFYAPEVALRPRKFLVGLIDRPEIILCIKTAEHGELSVCKQPQTNTLPVNSTRDGLLSNFLKLTLTILEISVSKSSMRATRGRANEILSIDCLNISFLGHFTSDLDLPVNSSKLFGRFSRLRHSLKSNSLFCPEILFKNFCCQIQCAQQLEFNQKPVSSKVVEVKNPINFGGDLPPPVAPPPHVNSLWKLVAFSPWKPALGMNFDMNSGHLKQDVFSMASELNQRNIPAALSISSLSLIARGHDKTREKSALNWELNVSPVCFVCCFEHLQKLSFFVDSSVPNASSAVHQSSPTSARLLLQDFPALSLSCSFQKVVLCAAFNVSDDCVQAPDVPPPVSFDALQISFEKTHFACASSVLSPDTPAETSASRGHVSVDWTFESLHASYMSIPDISLWDLSKFGCNIKFSLGQALGNIGSSSSTAAAMISRTKAATGKNGLVNRRLRRPSADAARIAFSVPSAKDFASLEIQCMCTEVAFMVTESVLLASAHCCRNALRLSVSGGAASSTDSAPKLPFFSQVCAKWQAETVSVMFGDFSRQKDAMTELLLKHVSVCVADEPGNFSSQIRSLVTESSEVSCKFSTGLTPASSSHSLHGVALEHADELVCLKGFKISWSSSTGTSLELKSLSVLLSEPVVFDVALAMNAIFRDMRVYKGILSKSYAVDDVPSDNSAKAPVRMEIKSVCLTFFYDSSSYAARVACPPVGISSDHVWLSLFHFVCSDVCCERSYKIGKGTLHHLLSIGKIGAFYVSPQVHGKQMKKHVAVEDYLVKNSQVLRVLDFDRVTANVVEQLATSLIAARVYVHAHEGHDCVNLNIECLFALLSGGSVFSRFLEAFACHHSEPDSHSALNFQEKPENQLSFSREIWLFVDCESMSFTFSASPRSKIQASFGFLSLARKTGNFVESRNEEFPLHDDDSNPTGPHNEFFEKLFEQVDSKFSPSMKVSIGAVVVSEVCLNYIPCFTLEKEPLGSIFDVTARENILFIHKIALSIPSQPAKEHDELKLRSMLHQGLQGNAAVDYEEHLQCPPLDHITLQIINVTLSVSVSPTTTVLGRSILKNQPYGLVDFGMILDDTLLAIRACQTVIDDGACKSTLSRSDSETKLAICLFIKEAKLRVKEHRFRIGEDGEVRVSGEGWLWALYSLQQDELIERQKRWNEVEKLMKIQRSQKVLVDDKAWLCAFNSENATIWKERVKKLKEKLRNVPEIIPDMCTVSIERIILGISLCSKDSLINSMIEKLDDSGAKRGVFQSEWPEFDAAYGGSAFGIALKLRIHLRAFENPLMKFESYEWGSKVVFAEERAHPDILIPCSIAIKRASPYRIIICRSCLPMKLYHQTQATVSGVCLFYGSSHAQCLSVMGAALSSLSPPSPVAVSPLLPFDKLRLMVHGSSAIKFVSAAANQPAIEFLLSISHSPQTFGDAVQFSFDSLTLETSLARLSLESRCVSINFLYGEKRIWPFLSSQELRATVLFDWVCLGSSCKHHFNQILNQVRADGGSLRSMMGKGDLVPSFRSAGVRLKLELDTVSTTLRLHVDSLTFIFRVLSSLDSVGNSFLQYKSFHSAEGFYFSLPERTKSFGLHILSISVVFRSNPVSIFCFYSGPMPSQRSAAPITNGKNTSSSDMHHGVFRFATKTFVFKLEQSHILQPASKYHQRMAIMMKSDGIPRKLEWVINTLEIETKLLSIHDVGFYHNCNGWYGSGNALVMKTSSLLHSDGIQNLSKTDSEPSQEFEEHFNHLEYRCECSGQCVSDERPCDEHNIIASSVGVKLTACSEKADGPRGSGQSQKSSNSHRSASLSEDAVEGSVLKKVTANDFRDRTRQWVGGLSVGEAGIKAASSVSSSPLVILSELFKKPLSAVIKSDDRYFVPTAFSSLGPSSPNIRVVDARDMMLDILADSLFVQISYENRYAYSVWSNGLRCSLKDEPVKRGNQDGYVQLSDSEIKWRRFLDPLDEMIGQNVKSSDVKAKLAVPEHWQHCNEFQGTISRIIWRLQLKEPQLGIEALPPERQGKNFQCRLQHRLLLTGKSGQILSSAVRFLDKKDKCWTLPRSHISLVMDGIMVRMAAQQYGEEDNMAVSRRRTQSFYGKHATVPLRHYPDENTYILTKLWKEVLWVTGDAARNAAQQIVMRSPFLKFSYYCDIDAPSSVKISSASTKENLYMHSPTHVDLSYGNVVSVLIKEVVIITDCVQFRVFSEVINGLLRPLPTEREADDMMEALRLNALLDVNQMLRIKKIEMEISTLERQLADAVVSKMEDDRRGELQRLQAELLKLTQAGQEQISEQRLRFLSYHLLNCTWELRAMEQEIDCAFEKGVRVGSQGLPNEFTTFSKVHLDDVFGAVSYASTEPRGFSFRVRSFVVSDRTSDSPRLGEFVFQPKDGLAQSPVDSLSEVQIEKLNASYIASAVHKFLGGGNEKSGTLPGSYSDRSEPTQQMLNMEIFKAPRVGGVDVYELLAIDVAAMTVRFVCNHPAEYSVRIPHEFFVLLYDFIFEAEKKAFLQIAANDFRGSDAKDPLWQSAEVMHFSTHDDADSELMNETKLEIKNRSRDNHHFQKVHVSRLNVLVSYKGPNINWNLRDINDLDLSVNTIEFQDQTLTWAEMFEQFKDKIINALIEQAPKVARHKLSDLFSRKKNVPLPSSNLNVGGSASAPVTPAGVSRSGMHMPRSAGGE